MAPKNQNNSERKTRNSSRGRSPTRGSHSAAPGAANTHLQGLPSISPTSNHPLPANNVNKVGNSSEASSPLSITDKPDNLSVFPPGTPSSELSQAGVSHTCVSISVTTQTTQTEDSNRGVGDNRGFENKSGGTTTAPESPSEKTLRLVLSELQEIRSEMASIRKIEENTAKFSKELAGMGKRTSELEEVFAATTARVRELG